MDRMLVLGIETSCDETACAIVDDDRHILANRILSQNDAHRPYLGVVPEIAARAHITHLDTLIAAALDDAGVTLADLQGIAATAGPGLIGGVLVGLMTGKALASVARKPFLAVNHLEGHALSARLSDGIEFPYLLLLVSGGHCQLLVVEALGRYRRLGTTIDDAVGEAFDKTAKILGLGFPGGPAVEEAATGGDSMRFSLPRPMRGRSGCDFSFSGLKTAVRQLAASIEPLTTKDRSDIAAVFQQAVIDILVDRTANAIVEFLRRFPDARHLVLAGGVAANHAIRAPLTRLCADHGLSLVVPPSVLCTDNGAMIAWAGLERLKAGLVDTMAAPARARWPLDPTAPPAAFAGVKA